MRIIVNYKSAIVTETQPPPTYTKGGITQNQHDIWSTVVASYPKKCNLREL